MTIRVAIAQIAMHWSTAENMAAIRRAMALAHTREARLCGFSELAVTGYHRKIGVEAVPERVLPAVQGLQAYCAELSLGIAVGAPTFGADGAKYNSHLLIDERGATCAVIAKQGLTEAEATFFSCGSDRPVGTLHGLRCSAVICREVADLAVVTSQLNRGGPPQAGDAPSVGRRRRRLEGEARSQAVDLIFVPGALRQDPEKPRTDPPEYVRDIQRLAAATRSYVVQTNWPNALNRPEESVEGGGSVVAAPDGELLFRLPGQASGVAVFTLGERCFEWHPQ